MVYPASDAFIQALSHSHKMVADVLLIRGAGVEPVPFVGGTVTATYNAQVGRSATVIMERNYYDLLELSTLSDVVMIRTGIPTYEMVPLITGRIDAVQQDRTTGTITLTVVDRAADVVRALFETPWAVAAGQSTTAVMTQMIQDVDPGFGVDVGPGVVDAATIVGAYEEDRGSALDELAKGINAVWMATRTGSFEIASNPYQGTAVDSGLIVRNGTTGTMQQATDTVSRQAVTNSVTVISEPVTSGANPIRVTVRDDDPSSPTYWGGPFGKQNCVIRNDTLTTIGEAQAYAQRLLDQSLAMVHSWQISTPHFPLLDPLDVFTTIYDGEEKQQVVVSIEYPLLAPESTTISSRELAA